MKLLIRAVLVGSLIFPLQSLFGQYISTEQTFPVEGYSVFEEGYPLKVVPGKTGQFAFLEYWAAEKQGRRTANHYLESYGTRNYVEHWFKPITNEGFEGIRVDNLLRLEKALVVIGRQYQEDSRLIQRVGRFFDVDGVPKGDEPVPISNYTRRPRKNFKDTTCVSLRGRAMLWLGYDDKSVYATAWNSNGKAIWEKDLEIPYWEEKYRLVEAQIDDEGNPFFLLKYAGTELPDREPKPLMLVKLDHEKDAYQTEVIPISSVGMLKHAHFQLLRDGGVVVTGVLVRNGGIGIRNGMKLGKEEEPEIWAEMFLKHYAPSETQKDSWEVIMDVFQPMPENWVRSYQQEGANFSLSRLIMAKDQAILLFEEHYTTRKKLYFYDVGCLGVRLSTGEIAWSKIIKKRQRDTNSDAFMSYVAGVARDKLRVVYLTERGAAGQLMCTSVELANGRRKDKMLASNEAAKYLFFPSRSGMVSNFEMVLIGRGNPSQNDFKLITISF
ncbi:MAG: hypothetical protein AAF399_22810 [Bacteroidota bacterium]